MALAFEFAALVAICAGVAMFSVPVALIVAGVAIILACERGG